MQRLGTGPVGLDTPVFIYLIEEHPDFLPLVEPLFAAVDAGRMEAVTSAITLLEVLVVPLRAGNSRLADAYERLLSHSRNLRLVDIGRSVARGAAHLRAATGMATADALQVSAALATRCTAFVTNDRHLPEIPGLTVLALAEHS